MLDQDPDLRALARTPLMLNVMAVAFASRGDQLHAMTASAGQELDHTWLCDTFIERMIARAPGHNRLPATPRLLAWLGWLARQTQIQQQPLFLLERHQPGWLERPLDRWLYVGLSRVLAGITFGSVIALSDCLAALDQTLTIDPRPAVFGFGALLGAGAGAAMGLIDAAILPGRAAQPTPRSSVRG